MSSTAEFPSDFTFGVATSAYQVEGGIENDWSDWERAGKLKNPNARCGDGVQHWERFFDDVALIQRLGATAYRLSIEWARVEPQRAIEYRMDDGREYEFGPGDAHVVSAGHDAWVEGDEPCVALDLAFTGRALAGHVGRCPCGVEFRVASDDQFGQLVAAIREHARSSHGHELTTQQVLAEVMA